MIGEREREGKREYIDIQQCSTHSFKREENHDRTWQQHPWEQVQWPLCVVNPKGDRHQPPPSCVLGLALLRVSGSVEAMTRAHCRTCLRYWLSPPHLLTEKPNLSHTITKLVIFQWILWSVLFKDQKRKHSAIFVNVEIWSWWYCV